MRPRRFIRVFATLVALAGATRGFAQQGSPSDRRFPHAKHARLFPTCASCHAGIYTGDTLRSYPSAQSCDACHDGRDAKVVIWSAPRTTPTNLAFSHVRHALLSKERGEVATCQSCHTRESDTTWMRVARATAPSCIGCHAHQAPEHLAEAATCTACHRSLTDARVLPAVAIAAFPKPASHTRPDFLTNHAPSTAAGGNLASCATCHARESCARCHPNAGMQPTIAKLTTDSRVAALMRDKEPAYPTPSSHRRASWLLDHGGDARRGGAIATCANCHTRASCVTCHTGAKASAIIAQLPPAAGGAPGVQLALRPSAAARRSSAVQPSRPSAPATVALSAADTTRSIIAGRGPIVVAIHGADFTERHRLVAATGRLDCLGCHQERTCTDCHAGTSAARRYHPLDFVSTHANDAYAAERNCVSCHRVETFCRSCHQTTGMASKGNANVAAHTGQPLWLLQHGQAARQGLTGCTSCHQQRDCLQCHSSQGLHVNPHGPGFDPDRMAARNKQMCATCHLTDPTKR